MGNGASSYGSSGSAERPSRDRLADFDAQLWTSFDTFCANHCAIKGVRHQRPTGDTTNAGVDTINVASTTAAIDGS
uniref:Uncharacterized protein n=1 Tax=Panagrolaimus sp. JU765 TaxID=591449 RepID=A0AC34RFK5_9BILA